MSYQPSLEDMAVLVEQQPEHFSSPVQTLRSLRSALQQGDNAVGQVVQENTVRAQYEDYLNHGGQPLTESPTPAMPEEEEGGQHDSVMGSACVECASLTPCIKKVEIVCHEGDNSRIALQGEGELLDTDGKIYFVAEHFLSGDSGFEGFLRGAPLADSGQVIVTLAKNCPHGHHTLFWTDEISGTSASPGVTQSDFTVETNPRPTLFNTDVFEPPHLAYEVIAITLDILMNRATMVREDVFSISLDGSGCFSFTSVTVPLLKFGGSVSVMPPRKGISRLSRSEGRAERERLGMSSNPRQVTHEQGWQISAGLDIVCGTTTKRVDVGSHSSETTTYDSAPSLRRRENARRQQDGVTRFLGALTNAAQRLSQDLCNERDDDKLFDLYTEGPKLGLALVTEQTEEQGGPGLSWMLSAGISVDFRFGVHVNIYEALKQAARRHPAGAALVAFMEDAEDGRNLGVAEYQISPSLFIDVSIGIGSRPSADTTGNANAVMNYDFLARKVECDGHVTGSLTALAGGGVSGYFDSIFTDRRVFKYEANISTTGGITIKTNEAGEWGYELFHNGAMLRVMGYKKVNVEESEKRNDSGGKSRKSQAAQSTQTTRWAEDRDNINTYRLADGYNGEFRQFS
ncbi:hypothetical protein [Halomonas organivorans]|uniref:Uncharacterized protein n=1 Tax=Halomonas organivorans TaxID=257772 RepID=A0A7W5C2K9_9GAMM|nr:hypothetical protein [Halomonas organivorans]MBB3142588.1 hypothetical protein [Halomonas organivorans]